MILDWRGGAFAACLVCAPFWASTAQAQDLRIATEGFYAPFNYFDDAGALAGFDIDIANALCETIALDCEIVAQDWDLMIPGLQAEQYDAVIASMSITVEREKQVAFTLPYYSNMLTFIAKEGQSLDLSRDKLEGKSVGVQQSTVSAEYLAEAFANIVDIREYDTQEAVLNDLADGHIDLAFGDNLPSYAWLQTEQGDGHTFVGEFIDIDDRIGIAVRKSDTELVDQLNQALITIIENGTYQEINAKYFPFSIYF